MRSKLFACCTMLCAIVAFSAMTAAAQAAPHWYKKNKAITPVPVTVVTSGNLTLSALGMTIKCKVNDAEEIWNPSSGGPGEDLVTSFTLSGCKSKPSTAACPKKAVVEVLANGLPWPSHLVSLPPIIRDEIQKVRLVLRCLSGTVPDEFEGTLTPEVGNGLLVFGGPGGGTLLDGASNPMTVSGKDKLTAAPGKITAEDP
jgi:hypothetical protein